MNEYEVYIEEINPCGGSQHSKKSIEANEITRIFRNKFYKISAWLGVYFPVRFAVTILLSFYPRPYSTIVKECVILVVYLMVTMLIILQIEKMNMKEK